MGRDNGPGSPPPPDYRIRADCYPGAQQILDILPVRARDRTGPAVGLEADASSGTLPEGTALSSLVVGSRQVKPGEGPRGSSPSSAEGAVAGDHDDGAAVDRPTGRQHHQSDAALSHARRARWPSRSGATRGGRAGVGRHDRHDRPPDDPTSPGRPRGFDRVVSAARAATAPPCAATASSVKSGPRTRGSSWSCAVASAASPRPPGLPCRTGLGAVSR